MNSFVKKTPEQIKNIVKNDINYIRYENIALNQYGWKGLPETIPERILERNLYYYGYAVVYDDDEFGYLCLPAAPVEKLNVYFEYVYFYVFGYNVWKKINVDVVNGDGVLVRNNYSSSPTFEIVKWYSRIITEIDRAIDTQIYTIKRPYIIKASEKTILTLKNLFKEVSENNPFVMVSEKTKDAIKDSLDLMQIKIDYFANDLFLLKNQVIAEFCSFFGIRAQTYEKRERLLLDEINSYNDFLFMNAVSSYDMRKYAAEQMNKKYGWSVEPYLKVTDNFIKSQMEKAMNNERNQGEVYNSATGTTGQRNESV